MLKFIIFVFAYITFSIGATQIYAFESIQKQNQTLSIETNGGSYAKASAEQKQEQTVNTHVATNIYFDNYVEEYQVYGQVRIGWPHRGGTCFIRYGETNRKDYPYNTSASCDEGSLVIGGLNRGKNYRFQISRDNHGWSKPIIARAK